MKLKPSHETKRGLFTVALLASLLAGVAYFIWTSTPPTERPELMEGARDGLSFGLAIGGAVFVVVAIVSGVPIALRAAGLSESDAELGLMAVILGITITGHIWAYLFAPTAIREGFMLIDAAIAFVFGMILVVKGGPILFDVLTGKSANGEGSQR